MNNPFRNRPWLWIVLLLVIQLGVWTAWITVASKHRVAEVPLAPRVSRNP